MFIHLFIHSCIHSIIIHSLHQENIYTVSSVHDRTFPIVYGLEQVDPRRKFYGFELTKLDSSFDKIAKQQRRRDDDHRQDRIIVEDVVRSEPTRLRSGRIVENDRAKVTYKITRNGESNIVDATGLKLWQRALGKGILRWSDQFNEPSWKSKYKI